MLRQQVDGSGTRSLGRRLSAVSRMESENLELQRQVEREGGAQRGSDWQLFALDGKEKTWAQFPGPGKYKYQKNTALYSLKVIYD